MRLIVDTEVCVGAGQCALAASEVFDQREDDGIVELRQAEPPAHLHQPARKAAELCPTHAIRVEE